MTVLLVRKQEKRLIEEIKCLPCFSTETCQVSLLSEGESHVCFKVTLLQNNKGKKYFVKSLAGHQATSNTELSSHLLAAKVNLAPAVLYSSPLWLVCEFIEGESLYNVSAMHANFPSEHKSTVAMHLMAGVHQLKALDSHVAINVVELLTEQINELMLAKHQQIIFIKAINETINKIIKISCSSQTLVLCHGDLNEENIRLSQTFMKNLLTEQAYLVDFECSGLAEVEYDIAMYLAINQLATSELSKVMTSYQQFSSFVPNVEKVIAYLGSCYLINAQWYFKAAAASEQSNALSACGLLKKAQQQLALFDQLDRLTGLNGTTFS
jgi:thiamine kinase-like enzyme